MAQATAGLDFGTTNSSIALASPDGEVRLASFPYMGRTTDSYRSILYLEQLVQPGAKTIKSWTGPEAIEHYLGADTKGRLIQSLKSFLTSRSLHSTEVFGRRQSIEELIARILRDLREKAEQQFGQHIKSAVVGCPVKFVGSESEADDLYAVKRLQQSFELAGFESVTFEYEPVAAAHFYQSTLDHDELIVIGDFGGGTSDFSLINVGPSFRGVRGESAKVIGNSGVGIAGDAFDAKIIRHLVSPALGLGTEMRSVDKILPVPRWVYAKLERWHHLSLLRGKDTLNMLRSVQAQAFEPESIRALIHLIEEDLGFQLHRAVQATKYQLSSKNSAEFHFNDGLTELNATVSREDFEEWISDELDAVDSAVESLLRTSGVAASKVDCVFLTGGSSFVPAVRRIFEHRFGESRIRTGNEFTSVARGLALRAQ